MSLLVSRDGAQNCQPYILFLQGTGQRPLPEPKADGPLPVVEFSVGNAYRGQPEAAGLLGRW